MLNRLLIVDGSSLLHESFYGTIPEQMKREKDRTKWKLWYHELLQTKSGIFTNGVFTAMGRLERILSEQNFTHIAVTFDITDETFRKEMYPDYKGNREKSDDCFISQKQLFLQLLQDLGYPIFLSNHYEADDCIGSLVEKFKGKIPIVILSGDRDMTQLVDNGVQLWYTCKKKDQAEKMFEECFEGETNLTLSQYRLPDKVFPVGLQAVKYMMGVPAHLVPLLKAIAGDSSDNYPGVAGVGEKGAIALLNYFSSADELVDFCHKYSEMDKADEKEFKAKFTEKTGCRFPSGILKENAEKDMKFFLEIATIRRNLDFPITLENLLININKKRRLERYEELEFYSLLHKNLI